MTRLEGPVDRATDVLNITPVMRELLECQVTEVGDVRPRKTTAVCPGAIAFRSSSASLVRPL